MTVLAAPNSGITTPAQLKGIEIAVSGNTVIEYATDRLLEMAGLAPADIRKTEVTKIPVRMELLSKGQVKAATLPEPFASLGEAMGARRIVDDGKTGVGTSAITVRSTLVEGNADALRRFLGGYERAVAAIASTPERYRALFIDKAKLPKEVERTLPVPPFPAYQLPTEQDVEAVVKWMVGRGLLKAPLTYAGVVAKGLAPRTTP